MKSKPLIWFFLLAIAFSWIPGFPAMLDPEKYGGLTFLPTFGPAIAAFIVAAATEGTSGLKGLLESLFQWKVQPVWYLVILLGPSVMMGIAFLGYALFRDAASLPDFGAWFAVLPQQLIALVSIFLFMFFTIWGEEVGWRGFALPKLQQSYHPLLASLILGAIWAVWHLPAFFTEGSVQRQMGFPYFFFATLGYSILYSWIYNGTRESLFMMCMLHAANNTTVSYTMLVFKPLIQEPIFSLAVLGLFDLLVIVFSKSTLLYQKQDENVLQLKSAMVQ
ncbi:MAG: type II CAAX endopeptidase family protein [Chloroflexota bacterium]